MDIFFLQLVIIFIPGIIWERIDNRFGVNRPEAQFDIIRRSFCFGLTSYLTEAAIFSFMQAYGPLWARQYAQFKMFSFQKDIYTLDSAIVSEIIIASLFAFGLAICWLYITNNKLPVRFMQLIRATRRFGDEDVWDFTFNSRRAEVEYVHFRDLDNKLNFSGWVELFSETGQTREIVIRDVIVSDGEGVTLYETPRVYLARAVDKITIEFPYRGQ